MQNNDEFFWQIPIFLNSCIFVISRYIPLYFVVFFLQKCLNLQHEKIKGIICF